MTLPSVVRKADQEADQAMQEFEAFIDEAAKTPSALDDSPDTQNPEAREPAASTEKSREPETEAPTPLPDPELTVSDKAIEAKLEQKLKTLQGKYNAEVPRLHKTIKELQQALDEAKSQQTKVDPKNLDPAAVRDMLKEVLSEQEIAALGDDALALYGKMAYGIAGKVNSDKVSTLEREISTVKEQMSRDASTAFWNDVERRFPGALEMNESDAGWISFLDETDEISGLTYRDIGTAAIRDGQASRIAALMTIYKNRTSAGNANEDTEEVKDTPVVKPSQTAAAAVARARTESTKTTAIRESDIRKFFDDVARGKYVGRETERAKREAIIDAAVSTGNVMIG